MLDATNVNAHATPDAVDSSFDPTSLELGDLFTFTAGPADDCGGWGVVIRALAEDAVTVRAWVMADNRTHRMVEIVSLSRITGRVSEPSQLQRAAVGEGLAVEIRNLADDDRITQARLDALAQQVGSLTGQLEDQQQAATRFRARVRAEALRVRTGQGWCVEGLNETLANLDLDRYEPKVKARLTVQVEVTVATADTATAARWCQNSLQVTTDDPDIEIGDVTVPANRDDFSTDGDT